jgi:hypothetical protein
VADIIREYGNSFIEENRYWLMWLHLLGLFAIEHCRTAALGWHLDVVANAAMRPPPATPAAPGIVQNDRPTLVITGSLFFREKSAQANGSARLNVHNLSDSAITGSARVRRPEQFVRQANERGRVENCIALFRFPGKKTWWYEFHFAGQKVRESSPKLSALLQATTSR